MMFQEQIAEQAKEFIEENVWETIKKFLEYEIFHFGDDKHPFILTVRLLLFVVITLIFTTILLRVLKRVLTRKMEASDRRKFDSVFSFFKYFIYAVVLFFTLDSIGFNITAVFAASAALLVGVGLALQTFFQDILSGIFIFMDKTVHVGDIIELDGKVGRVEEIKLRTTRAVTIDNRVLIIPNHMYLTNTLYNWTQNNVITRESIEVGVAYGSDTDKVKELLIQAALTNKYVIKKPEPLVLFTNFGNSSLDFKLVFTLNDSFQAAIPKSEIRFEIDRLFREHHIEIPFPQRVVTMVGNNI